MVILNDNNHLKSGYDKQFLGNNLISIIRFLCISTGVLSRIVIFDTAKSGNLSSMETCHLIACLGISGIDLLQ